MDGTSDVGVPSTELSSTQYVSGPCPRAACLGQRGERIAFRRGLLRGQ